MEAPPVIPNLVSASGKSLIFVVLVMRRFECVYVLTQKDVLQFFQQF